MKTTKTPDVGRILLPIILSLVPAMPAAEEKESRTIQTRGSLSAASSADVRSPMPGQVAIIRLVPEGTLVREGDLLVELDASGLEGEVIGGQAQMETAKAEIEAAEQALAAAREEAGAAIDVAAREVAVAENALKLFHSEKGEYALEIRSLEIEILLAERRVKAASGEPEEAKARLELARSRREFLEKELRPHRIAELELAVARARFDLIRARSGTAAAIRKAEAELVASRARFQMARSALERAERNLASSRIRAPFAGMVTYAGSSSGSRTAAAEIRERALVRQGQVILRISDVEKLRLTVSVSEADVPRIRPGQTAAVRLDAFPDRELRGRVASIGNAVASTTGTKLFPVVIDIEETPQGARPGMTGTASIILSAAKSGEE